MLGMDLPKLKIDLERALNHAPERASQIATVRQHRKAKLHKGVGIGPEFGNSETEVPAFGVDVDELYAAAATLWSGDTAEMYPKPQEGTHLQSNKWWPIQATAIVSIGRMMNTSHNFCYNEKQGGDDQFNEYYAEDKDGILQVLLEARFPLRLVELLLVPYDATPAQAPTGFGLDESAKFTSSTALQYSICQVNIPCIRTP